jgi:phenylalanyl-tRNA synthetase alpha chain
MFDKLQNIKNEALAQIITATSAAELENIRIHYFGKNGVISELAKKLATLSIEEKTQFGKSFNDVKISILTAISSSKFKTASHLSHSNLDATLPGIKYPLGHLHPITNAISEISNVFEKIGFTRARYPEVEWDWYAFEGLNFPPDHPARDDWETFFLDTPSQPHLGRMLLTPHTSSGQVREMERVKHPPIRMINIAKCYRRQIDISHTPMFHQFEGLVIDSNITVANLKGTTDYFVKNFFGANRSTRLRPYHFQFTEPSFEVDISCDICDGKGCRLCKEGWLELGGAGMVHPNVLKSGNIDPTKYSGFAFGWGVERTYMMKSGTKIDDIRLIYGNDIRFLNQF